MSTDGKSTFNPPDQHRMCSRPVLTFVSLLFVVVLACSGFVYVYSNNGSHFVVGAYSKVVSDETELVNAVDNAVGSITIALDNDITLTKALIIPANKDITLTSNTDSGYYKLIGASGKHTIIVEDRGVMRLDGIIVTHTTKGLYEGGCGVIVATNGKLVLHSGEISENSGAIIWTGGTFGGGIYSQGGGVYNNGAFEMHGGRIFNNESPYGFGGGVANNGTFVMSGGEISGNKAYYDSTMGSGSCGGGVYNCGSFMISGGSITSNRATYGGGVYNGRDGTFNRQGGVISDNISGDVYPADSDGSSNGSSGSSDGNSGSSNASGGNNDNSNGNNNDFTGDNGLFDGGVSFSLREVVIISVGIVVVTVGVVVAVMFFYIQKRMTHIEEKICDSAVDQI